MRYFWQFGIGVFVGFLMALSVSGATNTILAAVITIVISFASLLSGLTKNVPTTDENRDSRHNRNFLNLDVRIIFFLIFGVVMGAISGIYTRTHNLFGRDLSHEIAVWKITGLKDTDIAKRLFDIEFPTTDLTKYRDPVGKTPIDQSVLFKSESKICDHLCNLPNELLLTEINKINNVGFNQLLEYSTNPDTLKVLIKYLCKCEK